MGIASWHKAKTQMKRDIYVLGINGSPRIGGNTDILLDRALQGAASKGAKTEKIILNKLKIAPCQECAKIKDDGTCIVKDDFQAIFKKVNEANMLILASPIFFGSLSAQTKIMIDRFQCYWRYKYVLKKVKTEKIKKGAFISVESSERQDFFNNAKSIVKNFFATLGVNYSAELFCPGTDKKRSILSHPGFLRKAVMLGKKLASF